MALAFPFIGFERIGLQIVPAIATGRTEAGLIMTSRKARPHWKGPFATDKLGPAAWSDGTTFLADCVDRNERIDFVHPRYALPRLFTVATWPLVADPELVSVTNPRTIVVSGLMAGMQLKRGDRLALMQGELRCYRSIQTDLVVASAIAQSLPITPLLPPGVFVAGALVRMKNPMVRLAIVPGSFDLVETYGPAAITFEAEEALL